MRLFLNLFFLVMPLIFCKSDDSVTAQSNENKKEMKKKSSSTTAEISMKDEFDQLESEKKSARVAVTKAKKRYKDGMQAANLAIRAGSCDTCDWRSDVLPLLQGVVCGKYYKILGLDKHADRGTIKKAYRAKSLDLHPDKNPSKAAEEAFTLLTEAYDCLSDDKCRKNYDGQLEFAEQEIYNWRQHQLHVFKQHMYKGLVTLHHYVSYFANTYYGAGVSLWKWVGQWEVSELPVGRWILGVGLLWKGRWALALQSMSYAIMRLNYEFSRSQGLF